MNESINSLTLIIRSLRFCLVLLILITYYLFIYLTTHPHFNEWLYGVGWTDMRNNPNSCLCVYCFVCVRMHVCLLFFFVCFFVCTCLCSCVWVFSLSLIFLCLLGVCMCVCACVCVCVCVCVCMCVCVCVCSWRMRRVHRVLKNCIKPVCFVNKSTVH